MTRGLAVACTVDVDIGPNPGPFPDASAFPDGARTGDAENPADADLVDGGLVDATVL